MRIAWALRLPFCAEEMHPTRPLSVDEDLKAQEILIEMMHRQDSAHDADVARSRQACICIGWKQLSYSIYLVIASDLSTQCLSRQRQADGPLETGNHILTDITAGISRPQ